LDLHKREDGFQYGLAFSTLEAVKQTELIPLIASDVDCALNMNKKSFEANFLFIYPPSFEELRRRLGVARKETEQEFKVRIREAIKEIEKANNSVLFTNRLVNDKLDDAVDQFFTLIDALYFQEISNARAAKMLAAQAAAPKE